MINLSLATFSLMIFGLGRSLSSVTRLRAIRLGFKSRQDTEGIFLFATESRPVLRPNRSPSQWVPGSLTPGIKRPGSEADHSPTSSAEVKNA
jgi:hypothetical protein